MNDQILPSSSSTVAPTSQAGELKLWTPRLISVLTFLFGFPCGFVLAAINWHRMGLRIKARVHLLLGAFAMLIAILISVLLPQIPRFVWFGVNAAIAWYLANQLKTDIANLESAGTTVRADNWLIGTLISLGVVVLYLTSALVVAAIAEYLLSPR